MAPPGYKQDLAPPGGFKAFNVGRINTSKGPNGLMLFVGGAIVSLGGFYKVFEYNLERRKLKKEKVIARLCLVPLLQAEEDRRFLKQEAELLAEEAEIMKGVPGWVVGEKLYHTKRWVPPARLPKLGIQYL